MDRVRCDSDPADFCLARFKEGGKLGLQDVGEGGLAALVGCAGGGGAQSRCLFQVCTVAPLQAGLYNIRWRLFLFSPVGCVREEETNT